MARRTNREVALVAQSNAGRVTALASALTLTGACVFVPDYVTDEFQPTDINNNYYEKAPNELQQLQNPRQSQAVDCTNRAAASCLRDGSTR